MAFRFMLLVSRQGKTRLAAFFDNSPIAERQKIVKEVAQLVLARGPRQCNVAAWRDAKLVYRRYASLFFIAGVELAENELYALEAIHYFVEVLDRYFGNVCELDLIFNFHKAYHILDEFIVGGEIQESSKRTVIRVSGALDALSDESQDPSKKGAAAAF